MVSKGLREGGDMLSGCLLVCCTPHQCDHFLFVCLSYRSQYGDMLHDTLRVSESLHPFPAS